MHVQHSRGMFNIMQTERMRLFRSCRDARCPGKDKYRGRQALAICTPSSTHRSMCKGVTGHGGTSSYDMLLVSQSYNAELVRPRNAPVSQRGHGVWKPSGQPVPGSSCSHCDNRSPVGMLIVLNLLRVGTRQALRYMATLPVPHLTGLRIEVRRRMRVFPIRILI